MENRKGLTITLLVLSVLLLLVSGCMGYYIWWQGRQAELAATALLEEQKSASEENKVVSVLEIPAISLELPILWDYDEEELKTTICRFQGPDPGEKGNLVITGHDFLNGAHFGKLHKVKIGDKVTLYDEEGKEFTYVVYDTMEIKPDNVEALEDYEGDEILTLLTCSDNANMRLLVRCKSTTPTPE